MVQLMSAITVAENLCFVSMWEAALNPLQNLYKDTKCDLPSGMTRQTWFKVPINRSASFEV